jgi:CP family cyanate transporter-like MFS transporter
VTALVPAPAGAVPVAPRTGRRRGGGPLLVVAIALTAFNLRTAVSSIGPLLDEVRRDLALSTTHAGLLTGLPVLCFAAVGALAARASRASGHTRVLTAGLVLVSAGSLLRAVAAGPAPFLASSVLAFAGVAVGNVLLPVVVKQHFPARVGPVTGLYSTVLAVGAAAAAGGSAPLADLASAQGWTGGTASGWRLGLGVWALPAAAAAGAWLLTRPRTASPPVTAVASPGPPVAVPHGLRWALAGFFGAQALQAFVVMGWFGTLFREAGASATSAGHLLAVVAALSVPVSLVVPSLAGRARSQRGLVVVLTLTSASAYTGLLLWPLGGAWLWALLLGLGAGSFPLALTLIGLRSATPEQTASLSAFAQSAGYAVAAVGPLLVGWLHATGGWPAAFTVLAAALAVQLASGLHAAGTPTPSPAPSRPPAGRAGPLPPRSGTPSPDPTGSPGTRAAHRPRGDVVPHTTLPTTSDATFAEDVLASPTPVLVDFTAAWCPPCRMVTPVLERIAAEEAGRLRVVTLDVDENPVTARTHQVMGMPTLALFVAGERVTTVVGARPHRSIVQALEPHLGPAAGHRPGH